jgi:hypothetical protein
MEEYESEWLWPVLIHWYYPEISLEELKITNSMEQSTT